MAARSPQSTPDRLLGDVTFRAPRILNVHEPLRGTWFKCAYLSEKNQEGLYLFSKVAKTEAWHGGRKVPSPPPEESHLIRRASSTSVRRRSTPWQIDTTTTSRTAVRSGPCDRLYCTGYGHPCVHRGAVWMRVVGRVETLRIWRAPDLPQPARIAHLRCFNSHSTNRKRSTTELSSILLITRV